MFILISQLLSQAAPGAGAAGGGAGGQQVVNIQAQIADITPIASLPNLIEIGANAILTVGTIAALGYLLYGAFNWLSAGGEKAKVETGKSMMTQAIIGLVVLASVF